MNFILTFLFIFILGLNAKASSILLEEGRGYYEIERVVKVLEDPTNKLTIEDVSKKKFSKNFKNYGKKSLNFGFSKSTFWATFKITNKGKGKRLWYLILNVPHQDHITLYKKVDSKWIGIKTGDLYNFYKRKVKGRNFVFKINPDNDQYFIRLKGTTNQLKLGLASPDYILSQTEKNNYLIGLFFGLVLSFILYNLIIYFFTNSRSYLFYVFYIIFYGLVASTYLGYSQRFFFFNFPLMGNFGIFLFLGLSEFFLGLFALSYLKIRVSSLKLHRFMISLCYINLITVPLSSFLTPKFMTAFWPINITILSLSLIYCGLQRLKESYRPARYFLMAFSFTILGAVITSLGIAGILPHNFFGTYAIIIGHGFELIFLSMGLADRFNFIQEENLEMELEAKKLEIRFTKNIINEVEIQTKSALQSKAKAEKSAKEVSFLLHNLNQAVFTIDIEGYVLDRTVSNYSQELFGFNIIGRSVYDILFPLIPKESEEIELIKFAIQTSFYSDNVQWDMNKEDIPKKSIIKNGGRKKVIEIIPNAIFEDDICIEIMLTVTDITEKEVLENEIFRQKENDTKRQQIISELSPKEGENPSSHNSLIRSFLVKTNELFESFKLESSPRKILDEKKRTEDKEELDNILRHLHTIKGNSRIFGLTGLSSLIHKGESIIKSEENHDDRIKSVLSEIDSIKKEFDLYKKMAYDVFSISTEGSNGHQKVIFEIDEKNIKALKKGIRHFIEDNSKENLMLLKKAEENLFKTPFSRLLKNYEKMIEEVSTEIEKKVKYTFSGDEIYFDEKELGLLNDSLIHLLRNSLDHGIEKEESRKNLGKESQGIIEIKCVEEEMDFYITLKDDGQGIDPLKISNIAIEKNLTNIEEVSKMSDEEKVNFIFLPGFSSTQRISELSGRGIGMDVVKTNILKLKGDIKIKTVPKKGTEFLIRLPYGKNVQS